MRLALDTLAASYDSARDVARRKSIWMVLWLRARRDGDALRGFYRRNHFAERNPR